MIFDDESDQLRGEVSSWRDYRDETYIFYHSCIPDDLSKKTFPPVLKVLIALCSFR